MPKKIVIMGAAGRDFHNFNMLYRDDPARRVVAFTATQIPFIEKRRFPHGLAGPLYPKGIPIYQEQKLPEIIKKHSIDEVVFSYSDISHEDVMHKASMITALNASFVLIGAGRTMLNATRPVISVCAVRTGCGKSGVSQFIANALKKHGVTPVAIRHPMPYGELVRERVQRFSSLEDVKKAKCTIEEIEEFEPFIKNGVTVFAGIDYKEILREAEKEAQVIIWDGGNNDLPFIRPDLEIVVVDPLRPGHEIRYYPGEANLRRAHIIVINKVNTAKKEAVLKIRENIAGINPEAEIIETASEITVDGAISGKSVVVVEDGPTLTHGNMSYGAGIVAARMHNARPVDPAPFAVGAIKEALQKYPNLKKALPAVGYSRKQLKDLQDTLNSTPADLALIATPADLGRIIKIKKPCVRVRYAIKDTKRPGLNGLIKKFLKKFIS